MFFSPALQALTKPELGNHLKILCLSTGDSDGLGETRKKELEKAAVTLGVRKKEDVFIMDDQRFRDGMHENWNQTEIATVLAQAFAPQLVSATTGGARTNAISAEKKSTVRHQAATQTITPVDQRELRRAPDKGPQATIDVLLTFDYAGISGHPNHKSLYHGSKLFIQQIMKGHAGYPCPIALYTLTTTNVLRKYSFVLDLLPTYLVGIYSSIFENLGISRSAAKMKKVDSDDRVVFVSNIAKYLKAREAMVRGHQSQMVWFRWGWISLGRYMVVNDLRREYVHGS